MVDLWGPCPRPWRVAGGAPGTTSLISEKSECERTSSGEGVLAELQVLNSLGTAHGHLFALEGGESAAEGAILLLSQVSGRVSLLFELRSCSVNALLAQHGQDLGDVLANLLDHGKLDLGLRGHLGHAQVGESLL